MNIRKINQTSIIYLSIPLIIFLITYLNPLTSVISLTAVTVLLYLMLRQKCNTCCKLSLLSIILITIICGLWTASSGIGGYFYQNTDWHMRNAIFQDLIQYSLPVQYNNGVSLVYYSGIMLPSVIIGKIFYGITHSYDIAIKIGNFANFLYCLFGIILIVFNLAEIIKPKDKNIFKILAVLVLFSGMDILLKLNNLNLIPMGQHIEWHYPGIQYSSNTTLLYWVYNQCITAWLITLLIYKKPYGIQNFGYYGILSLFYAPFPFIGHIIYIFSCTIIKFIKSLREKHIKTFILRLFSAQNTLSVILILPIIYCYYKSNSMTSTAATQIIISPHILTFFLAECGLYLMLIYQKYRHDFIYYITVISLFIFPHIMLYGASDFCMRASVPALFITMIMILRFISEPNPEYTKRKITLCILLFLGAVTPLTEMYRGILATFGKTGDDYIKNQIYTLESKIQEPCQYLQATENDFIPTITNYCNYGAREPEKTIFFKYFARH